jgi:CheY-like chemotaxis protein
MSREPADDLTIYAPTTKGTAELKAGSTRLSTTALRLLVIFDGHAALSEVARRAAGLQPDEIHQAVKALLRDKFIDIVKPGTAVEAEFGSFFEVPVGAMPESVSPKFRDEIEKGLQSLDRTGYYVSIAQQAAGKKPPANGSKYVVLTIEDNAQFITALRMLLRLEGYEPRVAGTREEIVAALRTTPSPDVILLDVNLADVSGFDILARIRQHPALRSIPVIMLTAQTSRSDVLRALAHGANGYITKPFEHEVLVKSLNSVLGL